MRQRRARIARTPRSRDLLNMFETTTAGGILEPANAVPVTIRVELMDQVRKAIEEQRRFKARS